MHRRANVMVAASKSDARILKNEYPQYRLYVVLTPADPVAGLRVGEYVWTPAARELPASVRMRLRGVLAPLIDDRSFEEEFPETLLTW